MFPWGRAEYMINSCHGGQSLTVRPCESPSKQLDFTNFQKVKGSMKTGHKAMIEPTVILISI
jgi:hypothetical protein